MMMRNLRVPRGRRAQGARQDAVGRGQRGVCAGSVAACAMHSMQINYVTLYAKLFNLLFVARRHLHLRRLCGSVAACVDGATVAVAVALPPACPLAEQLFCHKNMR